MKLATFTHDGETRYGAVADEHVIDLSTTFGGTLEDLLAAGADGLRRVTGALETADRLPLAEVQLQAPVQPRKFLAVGLNYADHVAEAGLPTPTSLTVFSKATTSVTGPYAPVQRPAVSDQLDYEGELGIVIGTRCRHVTAETAPSVIAGYVVVNDFSVRDWQLMTPQWTLGKSFDTHGPLGPWIVTADELGDPHDLGLRTFVNGELRQSSTTSNLIFDCFDIVEVISQASTLEPGDVIATGTSSGVAAGLDGTPWLVPGDRVRVEVDGIGALENEIVAEDVPDGFTPDPRWLPVGLGIA
jgi:2-keto-4-pentenoate hydratase/2-oxohepta-3-ene-1,7-dioic acid hydratase in catechol pathway